MSTFIHLMRGQMSKPLDELGGKCPYMSFLDRGQMSEGEHVRPPVCPNFKICMGCFVHVILLGVGCFVSLQKKKHVVVFVHIYQNGRGVLCPWGVLSYTQNSHSFSRRLSLLMQFYVKVGMYHPCKFRCQFDTLLF